MPYVKTEVRDEFTVEVDGRTYQVKLYQNSFHTIVDREAVRAETVEGLRWRIPEVIKRQVKEREEARSKAETARENAKERDAKAFDALLRTKNGLIKVKVRGRDPRTRRSSAKYLITMPDGSKDSVGPYGLMAIVTPEDQAEFDALRAESKRLSAQEDQVDRYHVVADPFDRLVLEGEWDREVGAFFVILDDGVRVEAQVARELSKEVEKVLVARTHPYVVEYHRGEGIHAEDGTYTVEPLSTAESSQRVFRTVQDAEVYICRAKEQSRINKATMDWERAHRLPLDG